MNAGNIYMALSYPPCPALTSKKSHTVRLAGIWGAGKHSAAREAGGFRRKAVRLFFFAPAVPVFISLQQQAFFICRFIMQAMDDKAPFRVQ